MPDEVHGFVLAGWMIRAYTFRMRPTAGRTQTLNEMAAVLGSNSAEGSKAEGAEERVAG
ncbi:hypothetical protein [Streptomyces sp. NBC_01320]|uniref:hypothetical protein n=1 Tax=Streptomyces sp. NBC_01320 TaxID=2903824 RepID=UPI002E118DC4|nr:hypothetical protein OG395_25815 [Streptomyces sp. NBC_01320]